MWSRSAALTVIALIAVLGCRVQPVPVTTPMPQPDPPPMPVEQDAGADAAALHAACSALCTAGCTSWCPTNEADCERDLPNLLTSGITVDLGCLGGLTDCSTAATCVQ